MTDVQGRPDALTIEREFDAPVELIWQMWTDPEHFSQWYGPAGATIPVAEMDVRVGGTRLICMEMQGSDGPMQMWFTGTYLEVDEHRRLVYTEAALDERPDAAEVRDAGAGATHPFTEVRVELESVDGGTRMVMTHLGVPADSPAAAGWGMAFDKLAARIDTSG